MRQNKKTPLRDMTQNGRSAVHFPPRKRPADKGGIFSRMTMLLASTGLALLLTRVPAWAQVVITDQVVIDNGETETIGGTGSTLADPLQLEQNLVIGDASTGTLNVVDGGTLLRRSDGEEFIVWLGNEEASVGTLNVTGTSSVAHINALRLGESGTGILNINDGGHVLLGHATSFAALNTGSSASIAIDGSGSQMYVIGDFIFGGTGDADITLTNGATYGQEDGTTILGAYGGTANVSISGNSYFNPYLLTIGGSGSASLTLSDDGRLDVASILIAENEGSSGTLIFGAAAGEQAVAAGSIYAGYITFGNGTGQIVFNHTGSLDFNTILTGNGSIEAYSGSTYIYSNIDDFTGTINVHGGSLWVDDGIGVTATVGTGGILSTMSQFDAVTILDGGSLGNHTTVDTLLIEGSYLLDKGYSVFADQATIASEVDSSATMTMTDGAIAGFGSLVIGDAGNGALTAEDGASLLVTGQAVIGAQTGSTGSLSLQGSATNFHADQLQIGVDGDGSLFLGDRSSVSIEGGSGFDVAAGTGTGYLSLDGHSHIYVGAGGTIRLGGAGNATVEILAGSDIDASAPDATVIAEQATSTSSLTVSGAGSSYVTRAMSIGEAGQASLIVSDGGGIGVDYNLGRMNTSNQGSGTILVTDSGSLLRVGNLFWSGNDGKIEILDGGKLTARDRVTINTVTGDTFLVAGEDSVVEVSTTLTLGEDAKGNMTIKDGATVSAGTAIAIATTAGGSGSLSIGAESGSAAAAAGFVDTSLIAFGAGDGHLVFNHTDTDYLLSSAITGSGAIDVYSGFTTLTGDLGAYFGEATVKGGRLSINSNFGGTAIVQDGGTLGGNGTLQAVTLESGSTLAPGNSIGTLTVNNDLDFVDGSIYAVEVDNLGHADKVVADGSITIDTGAILSVSAENGSDRGNTYQPYTTYTILEAAALSGAFGTVEDDFAFLDASVTYDSVSATLSLQRNDIAFETLAETPNQKHVAEAIDSLGGGDLYEAILGLPEEEPAGAFDQLSGEIYADLGTGLMQESLALGDLLANRLGAAYEADAAASYASSVSGYAAFEDSFDPAYRPATSVWMTGLGSRLELGAGDGTHAADATTGGFAFGADNLSETGWRLGLAAGVGHANLGLDDLMSSADSETYHLAAYAGRQFGPIGVSLGLSESWSDISTERKVAFADFSEDLKADVSARTTQSFLEAGWRSGYDLWHFEPFDRVAFAHTRTGSVEETGGSAALMSAGLEAKSWVNTLGLRVGRDIAVNGTLGKLRGSVAWRRTLSDTASTASLSFDGSKTFLVSGADAARDAALISLGADLEIAPGALLSVDYVATMSEESQGQDISARLKVEF